MAPRRAARVPAHAPIDVGFINSNQKFTAPLINFSPFGFSVKTPHEVKPGAIFKVGIQVGTEVFRAAAVVRELIPGGFGVEFLSMHPEDRQILRRQYARLQMAARDSMTG